MSPPSVQSNLTHRKDSDFRFGAIDYDTSRFCASLSPKTPRLMENTEDLRLHHPRTRKRKPLSEEQDNEVND